MSYNPLLFTKLPYDADTDFVPVTRLFFLIEGVFVHPSLNVKSIAELKALAQSQARRAQLRHAGRRLVPRPVPASG